MPLGTLAFAPSVIKNNGQYVAMVIITLAYLIMHHENIILSGDSARFVLARSFNTILLDYPLIKWLSYLYTTASVTPSLYLFLGIHNMLPYENWHIKTL